MSKGLKDIERQGCQHRFVDRIVLGDCFEGMKEFRPGTIDCIITDPPYGMAFMGKDWDKAVPRTEIWEECLRVLKPSGFAFIMCIPRQDCQFEMIKRLRIAGFETGFTSIYWAYASGFPKAGNVSKMVDKKLGYERERIKSTGNLHNADISHNWSEKEYSGDMPDKKPISGEARHLDGSYCGFQPKPAVEVILVAMKPLSEKSFVDQALKNGKGVTWLDDYRVPYESEEDKEEARFGHQTGSINTYRKGIGNMRSKNILASNQGRFPANLLVSGGVLDDGIKRKSGWRPNRANHKPTAPAFKGFSGDMKTKGIISTTYPDSGSFSRYFSLDAWWQQKVKELPEEVRKTFPFLIVPKASKGEKNRGLDKLDDRYDIGAYGNGIGAVPKSGGVRPNPYKNIHPTTKPLKLMSYLITLATRRGDVVLDPFIGSGTTAVAARLLGRGFIGFEIDKEYHKIAEARLKSVMAQKTLMEVKG